MLRMMQSRALSATLGWSRHGAKAFQAPIRTSLAGGRWKSSSNDLKMKTKMRDELAEVITKQKPPSVEQQPKPSFGFVQFLKANKKQFLNMGASFFLVLLAYQIVALQRSGRFRQNQLDERKKELAEKQELLRTLTSDDFVTRIAQECAAMVLLEEDAKSKWSIGRRQLSADELAEKLHPVIDLLLNEQIGDAGLTEEQKKEKTVAALRNAQVSQKQYDMEEVIAVVEDGSGQKVVQKRVFSM